LVADLDPNQPTIPGRVDESCDLEAAQSELLGDLDLGPPVEVVAARD
jgi:hypothetical protein